MFPSRTRVRPRQLERRLPWSLSLAGLLIPLVLSVLTAAYVLWFRDDRTEVVVVDRATGTPIAGAVIETDGAALQTDRTGRARLSVRAQETIRVSAPDHDAVLLKLDQERVRRVRIELRPNVVTGSVTRSSDGAPIAGATVQAVKAGATIVTAESDTRGQYLLRGVPEGAEIRIEHPDYAPMVVMLANDQTRLDAVLRPDVVLGIVRDTTGRPVRALVAAARGWVETGEDGSFRLKGVSVGDQVFVKAPGFRA
ncbi:MAG: carboxypeptidase regulatory-like domain-containing protein, partial [Thermomicrobium sp.]|nr:carboxypeptidase regulatory-like domain-containing protein [Thermomicrobium sp.]